MTKKEKSEWDRVNKKFKQEQKKDQGANLELQNHSESTSLTKYIQGHKPEEFWTQK